MKDWLRLRLHAFQRFLRGCLSWWATREVEEPPPAPDGSAARRRDELLEIRKRSRDALLRSLVELDRTWLAPANVSATFEIEGDRAPVVRVLAARAGAPRPSRREEDRDIVERLSWRVRPRRPGETQRLVPGGNRGSLRRTSVE